MSILAWVQRHRRRRAAVVLVVASLAASTLSTIARRMEPAGAPPTAAADVRRAVRVWPRNELELAWIRVLALDEWTEHLVPGAPIDVVVDRAGAVALTAQGVRWAVLVEDIDAVATAERERLTAPSAQRPTDWFAEYHDFVAIAEHLRELAARRPDVTTLEVIGGSAEGRPLLALHINAPGANKVPILLNGTQHAREWIASMVPICIAERALARDAAPELQQFLAKTDLWVIPVVNPDGYQYTWSSDRYWRKNRAGGHGVDLNRNFSIAWGGDGSSANKRSQIYRGTGPFSERESAALRDLVIGRGIALHVDFHSYGQLLLHPWTHTKKPAPDRDRFAAIADRMASAIYAARGQRYEIMPGAKLYPASGTMTDWASGHAQALSFTIELRPRGGSGFVLPPDQIRPTCDEALAAVLELRQAADLPRPR